MKSELYKFYMKSISHTIKRLALGFYISTILCIFTVSASEKVIIAGDYFCPYNCVPQSNNPGYVIELLQEILKPYDIAIEYVILSRQDALQAVKSGEIHGLISIGSEDLDNIILTSQPIAEVTTGLYTTLHHNWVLDGVTSLTNKKICTVKGNSCTHTTIRQYILDNYTSCPELFVIENESLASINCLNHLVDGNVDIVVESDNVINFLSNDQSIRNNQIIHRISDIGTVNIYVGFSPLLDRSKDYAISIVQEINAPYNQEKIKQLSKKYGL